jgi:hypothetical protein
MLTNVRHSSGMITGGDALGFRAFRTKFHSPITKSYVKE